MGEALVVEIVQALVLDVLLLLAVVFSLSLEKLARKCSDSSAGNDL